LSDLHNSSIAITQIRCIPVERMAYSSSGRFKGEESPPCLLPALRVIRHPPLRSCSCPQRRPQKQPPKPLRGAPPLAPASRVPNLPRCACADLRSRSALSIPLRSITRVGIPLGLQLLPPAFARWRSACMSHATATTTATAKEQRP
jgi:hypothetical protein